MNVPKLRFKDDNGQDFPEWEEKTLNDIFILRYGKDYKHLATGNIPVLGTGGIMTYVDKYLYDKPSVLIGRKGTIDKPQFINQPFWTVDTLFYTEIREGFSPFFVYSLLLTIDWYKFNEATGVPSLNTTTINSIAVTVPSSFKEQTKIANFLSAVDDKIAELTEKVALLQRYKKGAMQQIFSQQLRFKDDNGQDFPEWDIRDLETISCKVTLKNKDFSVSHVLTNSATQGIISQSEYFDRDIANKTNLNGYYVVELDDFIYNPRISTHALVGPIKRNKLIKGVMSPLYTVFRFKEGNLSFFEQYFETTHWHEYMKNVSNTGVRHDRMNITNESFFSLPIPYPSLPEQTKIANFLSALDEQINTSQQQLDSSKKYKQSLLQQMFI